MAEKFITKSYLLQTLKNFFSKIINPLYSTKEFIVSNGTGISKNGNQVSINPDAALSASSTNNVQNKVLYAELAKKCTVSYLDFRVDGLNGGNYIQVKLANYLPSGFNKNRIFSVKCLYWGGTPTHVSTDLGAMGSFGDVQVVSNKSISNSYVIVRVFYT